jgi:hypothetical protein
VEKISGRIRQSEVRRWLAQGEALGGGSPRHRVT